MDKEIFEMNTNEFERWLIDNTCLGPLNEMEKYKKEGKIPEKFPEKCKNCWKVLVFDIPEDEAQYIKNKYSHSKYLEMENESNNYLVVIYTKSEQERDNVRSCLKDENKVTG